MIDKHIVLILLLVVVSSLVVYATTTSSPSEVITSSIKEEVIAQLQQIQKTKATQLFEQSINELTELLSQNGYGDLAEESDATLDVIYEQLEKQETFLKKQLEQMQLFLVSLKAKYDTLMKKHEEEMEKLINIQERHGNYSAEIQELEKVEKEHEEELEKLRIQLLEQEQKEAQLKQYVDDAVKAYEDSKSVKATTETHITNELEHIQRALQMIEKKRTSSDPKDTQFDIKQLYEFVNHEDPKDKNKAEVKSQGASTMAFKSDHAAVLFDIGSNGDHYEY
jgi:chromosome segregation ATPase